MHKLFIYPLIIMVFVVLAGCGNSYLNKIERLGGFNYETGVPELRLIATGYIDEKDETYINVAGDVVYASLIYSISKQSKKYEASFSLQIQIKESDMIATTVVDTIFSDTVSFSDNLEDYFNFQEDFQVLPGRYSVYVMLTDQKTGKKSEITQEVETPLVELDEASVTSIRILGKDSKVNETFIPITTYDISGRYDSLQFQFQVTNKDAESYIEIETRLLKFYSDQSVALPIYYIAPTPSSIEYRGIDFSKKEELFKQRRELSLEGSVFVDFYYANLEPGNYRLEVIVHKERSEIFRGIDFGVRSYNYPTLKSAKELAQPLKYIMSEKEYSSLMEISSSDSLRYAIEYFWLSNIKNSIVARQVLMLYYQRVEEANKLFSNFKEGWKTDPGMVYILFGPPWYLDVQLSHMEWAYSYNYTEADKRLFFNQFKPQTRHFPFTHYILERSQRYHTLHYRQIQDWRSGRILTTQL